MLFLTKNEFKVHPLAQQMRHGVLIPLVNILERHMATVIVLTCEGVGERFLQFIPCIL